MFVTLERLLNCVWPFLARGTRQLTPRLHTWLDDLRFQGLAKTYYLVVGFPLSFMAAPPMYPPWAFPPPRIPQKAGPRGLRRPQPRRVAPQSAEQGDLVRAGAGIHEVKHKALHVAGITVCPHSHEPGELVQHGIHEVSNVQGITAGPESEQGELLHRDSIFEAASSITPDSLTEIDGSSTEIE